MKRVVVEGGAGRAPRPPSGGQSPGMGGHRRPQGGAALSPHPPAPTVTATCRGLQQLFDAATVCYAAAPPTSATEEATAFRGLGFLALAGRRACPSLALVLPEAQSDRSRLQQRIDEQKRATEEALSARRARQQEALRGQQATKTWHEVEMARLEQERVDQRLGEMRDTNAVADIDRKAARTEERAARREQAAQEAEGGRVLTAQERAERRRRRLEQKRQQIEASEKEVQEQFNAIAAEKEKWASEKEALGHRAVQVDLTTRDPRTGLPYGSPDPPPAFHRPTPPPAPAPDAQAPEVVEGS
eukprot:TRINITY_DN3488_c0_g2_i2.p1 TRINITY_DN3488_c0_g2~~TRINITY_DN3488_c0_g2_i2.p1  ORF type:complete len:301 (+),score=114.16 TRINITY_DN3488_c0_g2_i2:271-1173(+)